MNRIFFLPVLILATSVFLSGCNLPRVSIVVEPTPTSSAVIPTDTAPPPASASTAELGLAENPLILALPASADSQEEIDAAGIIAAQLTERTGYVVVTVLSDSQTALVNAFEHGNAHIAVFEPYAYELAYQKGLVKAAFSVMEDGASWYGAQFIAPREEGFTSYFNELNATNTISDPTIALTQLSNKKPCWSDETSPSGYIVPLGYLNSIGAPTQPAAFVEGQPAVVRAIYAGGICDFGASYIDARKFPSLEDEFPDLIEKVVVIWRIPDIIPHNVLAFSSSMPATMRDLFSSIIPAILQTVEGKAAFQAVYNIEAIEASNDASYNEFRNYVSESQVDLAGLVK
jgi:ABC-type phosphate/phosphonate transport system substrate-binding protein